MLLWQQYIHRAPYARDYSGSGRQFIIWGALMREEVAESIYDGPDQPMYLYLA